MSRCASEYPGAITLGPGRAIRCEEPAGHSGEHGHSFAARYWSDDDTRAGESLRTRNYAASLDESSVAYALAADAVVMRRYPAAARALLADSLRLHREAGAARDRADDLEAQGR